MNLLLQTLNGVAPVFLVIFLGMLLEKLKFFSKTTKDELVKLVYFVGTPALLFLNVATADLYSLFDLKFMSFIIIGIITFVFILIGLCFFIKDRAKKAAVIQIGFRSNFAIIGIPLAISLLPQEGVALAAVTLGFVVITYNVMAVIILSYYGKKEANFLDLLLAVVQNPLIISTFIGFICSTLKVPLPQILTGTLSITGQIASSMGLLIIGATVSIKGFQDNKFNILYSVFLRNIVAPLFFVLSAILLGFRDNQIIVIAILSSGPAAVNCFVLAKKLGADADISAFGVSFTSIFSILSVFLCVYTLKILGYA